MASIIKANKLQDFAGNDILSSDGAGVITPNADGIKNVPAFSAKSASDQSISNSTFTKVTLGTEVFDTNNAFALNKFTVPSGEAGKYLIAGQISINCSSDARRVTGFVYKNGSALNELKTRLMFNGNSINDGDTTLSITGTIDLSVGDYLELYGEIYTTAGGTVNFVSGLCVLQGYKLIGA